MIFIVILSVYLKTYLLKKKQEYLTKEISKFEI